MIFLQFWIDVLVVTHKKYLGQQISRSGATSFWSWVGHHGENLNKMYITNSFRKPYSKYFAQFSTGFVDFDREDFISKTFDKIFCIRLALPHFSCISYFLWKSTHHGEILDLVSKYCRKREVNDWIPTHNTWITMFSTVFSTQNPWFLHDELIFRKNMIYMKNA